MMVSFSHQERGHIRWDVLASASSVPNIRDKSAKLAGLRSTVMGLTKMHIAAFLLLYGLCNAETTGSREIKVNDSNVAGQRSIVDDADADCPKAEDAEDEQDAIMEDLPILPPIILLDFDNGTIDDNATAEDKSKRTVNNGLGYGFERNSLLAPRKYNYYFPAGKTGTTVSIEESISPFLPRTIIEKVQSSMQKPVSEPHATSRQQGSYRSGGAASSFRNQADYQYYNPATKSQPIFGLRTKLTKTSNSEPYGGFIPIARPEAHSNVDYRNGAHASTTPQPLLFSPTEPTSYVTPSPQGYTVSGLSRYTYITSSPPSYVAELQPQRYLGQNSRHTINVQGYARPMTQNVAQSSTSNPNSLEAAAFLENIGATASRTPHGYLRAASNVEPAAAGPTDVPGYIETAGSFADLSRYTMENGVRYENKIFWKYPDGRVSDMPPMTYETYSEYPSLAALQAAKSQEAPSVYETTPTENRVLSQGPVQFPMAPESGAPSSQFISADSLSRVPQQHVYRLGYQNLVNSKQVASQQTKAGSGVSSAYSVSMTPPLPPRSSFRNSSNRKNQKSRYDTSERTVSRYMVNSPNPEYSSYTTESIPRSTTSSFLTSSAGENSPKKTNANGKNLENYSNLQYTDLLNYNPSISQYIKNPASILNVQPTFVQAGNSLIPVIILRVDGVPPIQPKATPNVNLKALLQQYLLQYANSIEELARPSTYDLGNDQLEKDQSSFSTNPLRELIRLAQNSRQDLIGNPTESYIGKSSYETSNLEVEKSLSSGKYGQRTAARPKVKNVQIIEDPRFPSYREKN